jgi:hypothetical protein
MTMIAVLRRPAVVAGFIEAAGSSINYGFTVHHR